MTGLALSNAGPQFLSWLESHWINICLVEHPNANLKESKNHRGIFCL